MDMEGQPQSPKLLDQVRNVLRLEVVDGGKSIVDSWGRVDFEMKRKAQSRKEIAEVGTGREKAQKAQEKVVFPNPLDCSNPSCSQAARNSGANVQTRQNHGGTESCFPILHGAAVNKSGIVPHDSVLL
jgi:hypothetical protein